MYTALSPEAIEALKWIDRFGTGRPVPAMWRQTVDRLLNDGFVYQSGPEHADLTADGRAYLSEECDR